MKFANLTKAQKRFVVAALTEEPSLATATEVTRKELVDVYWRMHAKRQSTDAKIGFPNWLCNTAKTGRGAYVWPVPTEAQVAAEATTSAPKAKKNTPATQKARQKLDKIMRESEPVVTVSDEEFLKELQEAGIEV